MTLTGLYVPLITPFDANGAVALDALEALVHDVIAEGAVGVVALGTTAEPGALTEAEQRAVVEVAARACQERGAHLVVGAGTPERLDALRHLPGAAALTLVPPFVRPGEDGVLAYFRHLSDASPVPIIVYHVPYRTGQQLSADTLRRLADIPGVVGIKHAVGGIDDDTIALLAEPPGGFAVLGGDDPFISPLLALGAHGGILASAHLATQRFAELIDAWHTGDVARARTVGHSLAMLSRALFAEPNPTVLKAVLHAHGRIPTAAVRLPLVPASAGSVRVALRHAMPWGRSTRYGG